MNIKPIHCLTTLTCVLLPRAGLALPQAPSSATAARPVEATAHASVADPGALAPLFFWADWSADGFMDAWVVQPDGSGLLLENNGLGGFHDRTPEAGLSELKGAQMAAWAGILELGGPLRAKCVSPLTKSRGGQVVSLARTGGGIGCPDLDCREGCDTKSPVPGRI